MRDEHPRIIQGGMGIGVSDWRLARAVSKTGQLGTVSGTGIWLVMARRLQMGDPGGHVRRALALFPAPTVAEQILRRYYIKGGKGRRTPFRAVPMLVHPMRESLAQLIVAGSFVEVILAKEGHEGRVGVNYLEKIQLSHLPSLYGAMLAGVDYVLMGAGIPVQIPEALDLLACHQPANYRLHVEGALPEDVFESRFDPEILPLAPSARKPLNRPYFLPIISSHVLAQVLLKRCRGRVDGFVVEGPTAGGHNAPPRNRGEISDGGEPLYGEQDRPDLEKIRSTGLPFWLAGSYSSPDSLQKARDMGAYGTQVGSIFALSRESGLTEELRSSAIAYALAGKLSVRTNGRCSPSGYPFKEAALPGTLADPTVVAGRRTVCDIGCLRTLYRKADGKVGYRCPAEPEDQFLKKGGSLEEVEGRRCLCNTLTATIGLGQVRPAWGYDEPPLLTLGTDLGFVKDLASSSPYGAVEAVAYLEGKTRVD